MRRLAFVLSMGALLGLTGCGEKVFGPELGGAQAYIYLTCDPNPIVAGVTGGGGSWAARYEAVLQEKTGVGATILYVHGIVFDNATGLQVGTVFYDSPNLKVFSGGDTIEPLGEKKVLQQISYSTSGENLSAATLMLQVKIRDDGAKESTSTILVKIQ